MSSESAPKIAAGFMCTFWLTLGTSWAPCRHPFSSRGIIWAPLGHLVAPFGSISAYKCPQKVHLKSLLNLGALVGSIWAPFRYHLDTTLAPEASFGHHWGTFWLRLAPLRLHWYTISPESGVWLKRKDAFRRQVVSGLSETIPFEEKERLS